MSPSRPPRPDEARPNWITATCSGPPGGDLIAPGGTAPDCACAMSACKLTGGAVGVAVTVTAAGGGAAGSGIGVTVTGGGAAAATSVGRAKPGRSAGLDGMALSPAPTRGVAERTCVMGVGSYAGGCVIGGVDVGSKVVAVVIEVAPEGGGAEAIAGGGAAAAVSTGATCPGGVHPGGGSNALFGSTRRDGAGAAGTTTGAGGGAATAVSVGGGKSVVAV